MPQVQVKHKESGAVLRTIYADTDSREPINLYGADLK